MDRTLYLLELEREGKIKIVPTIYPCGHNFTRKKIADRYQVAEEKVKYDFMIDGYIVDFRH